MYSRQLKSSIQSQFNMGKVIILIGPRQVGKTTLVKDIMNDKDCLEMNGDDPAVRELLKSPTIERLKSIIGEKPYFFIDEAQRIEGIGLTLKLLIDEMPKQNIIISGSSALELNALMNEPLTGRKKEFKMFPISWLELEQTVGVVKAYQQLENRLLFGMYPEVMNSMGNEREVLTDIIQSYLYKDILAFSGIRKPVVLEKILEALAYQIGNEVSYNEIAQLVGVDKNTVNQYISILEQAYVVFSLKSYSRNLRNEIKTNQKIYFHDIGLRNAVIQNFSPIDARPDKGAIWENFLIAERMKQNHYQKSFKRFYFWRTVSQQEIDLIEEVDGNLSAFEFKWSLAKKVKTPKSFLEAYDTELSVVNRENFQDFVKG